MSDVVPNVGLIIWGLPAASIDYHEQYFFIANCVVFSFDEIKSLYGSLTNTDEFYFAIGLSRYKVLVEFQPNFNFRASLV